MTTQMSDVIAFHFWSPTCAPCKAIKPSIETLKEDFEQVQWVSVNTHADPENIAGKFGVTMVPTMVVTKKNDIIGKVSGTAMAEYYRILRAATR